MKMQVMTIALVLLGLMAYGKELTKAEVEYKADFIIKAVDYVTWPDGTETDSGGVIVIAILGESDLDDRLTELAAEKTKKGQKITVKTVSMDDDLTACQVLFVSTEDKAELAKALKKVKNSPVLTVSDAYYFARYGVMINFYTEEASGKEKVKFEVNTMTLKFVGLKMSSKLLKRATII